MLRNPSPEHATAFSQPQNQYKSKSRPGFKSASCVVQSRLSQHPLGSVGVALQFHRREMPSLARTVRTGRAVGWVSAWAGRTPPANVPALRSLGIKDEPIQLVVHFLVHSTMSPCPVTFFDQHHCVVRYGAANKSKDVRHSPTVVLRQQVAFILLGKRRSRANQKQKYCKDLHAKLSLVGLTRTGHCGDGLSNHHFNDHSSIARIEMPALRW